jgi:hypothetical protein
MVIAETFKEQDLTSEKAILRENQRDGMKSMENKTQNFRRLHQTSRNQNKGTY